MNARHRARVEKELALKKQLGAVEYARQKAEKQLNEKARECAEKIVDRHTEIAIREATNVMQYIMCISMNKLFDMQTKEINALLDEMRFQMECIRSGLVTGDDIVNWCTQNGIIL